MAKSLRPQGPPPGPFPPRSRPLPRSSRRTLRTSTLPLLPGSSCVPWFHRPRSWAAPFPDHHNIMTTPSHFRVPLLKAWPLVECPAVASHPLRRIRCSRFSQAAGTSLSQSPLSVTKTKRILRFTRFLPRSRPRSRVRRLRGDPARPVLKRPLARSSPLNPQTRLFTTPKAFR